LSGTWARSDKEKAETFAMHLEQVFQPFQIQSPLDTSTQHPNYEPDPASIQLFSPSEVVFEIDKNLNPKKAPGHDEITGRMIKELPKKGLVLLTYIFNAIIRLRYVPSAWKKAQVIMIPKPGKPTDLASSYRPISSLPVASKLFEILLLKRLKPVCERGNLIPDFQFGFRNINH